MIIRKNQVQAERAERESFGVVDTVRLSQAGGLSQYGAYVQTLHPGARSSNKHWHENEDEFLYVLSGEVTVTEGTEAQVLHAGDAACWPAGVPNAHQVSNRSNEPCSYLIVGTRVNSAQRPMAIPGRGPRADLRQLKARRGRPGILGGSHF